MATLAPLPRPFGIPQLLTPRPPSNWHEAGEVDYEANVGPERGQETGRERKGKAVKGSVWVCIPSTAWYVGRRRYRRRDQSKTRARRRQCLHTSAVEPHGTLGGEKQKERTERANLWRRGKGTVRGLESRPISGSTSLLSTTLKRLSDMV